MISPSFVILYPSLYHIIVNYTSKNLIILWKQMIKNCRKAMLFGSFEF